MIFFNPHHSDFQAVSGKSLDIWQTIYREPLRDKSMNLISASLSCDIDALEKRFEGMSVVNIMQKYIVLGGCIRCRGKKCVGAVEE